MAPAAATRMRPTQGFVPRKMVLLAIMMPARGMTISLGRGIQQLSIAIASTMPASPVTAYRCMMNVVSVLVRFVNKNLASFAFMLSAIVAHFAKRG